MAGWSLAEASIRAGVMRPVWEFLALLGIVRLKGRGKSFSSSRSKILSLSVNRDSRVFVCVDCVLSSFHLAKISASFGLELTGVG